MGISPKFLIFVQILASISASKLQPDFEVLYNVFNPDDIPVILAPLLQRYHLTADDVPYEVRYLVAKFLSILFQPITGRSVIDIFNQDCKTAYAFIKLNHTNDKIFTNFLDKLIALNINEGTVLDNMIDNVIQEFHNEPGHLEIIELQDFLKYLIMDRVHPEIMGLMYYFCLHMYAFTMAMDTMVNLSLKERTNLLGRAISASNFPDYGDDVALAILTEFVATREEKSNLEGIYKVADTIYNPDDIPIILAPRLERYGLTADDVPYEVRYLVAKFLNILVQPITGRSVIDIFNQDCKTGYAFIKLDPTNDKIFTNFLDKLIALNINEDTDLDTMIANVVREFHNEPGHLEIIELHDFVKYLIMRALNPQITRVMFDFCGEMSGFTAAMDLIENLQLEGRSNLLGKAISASNFPDYGDDAALAILTEFVVTREEKSKLDGTNREADTIYNPDDIPIILAPRLERYGLTADDVPYDVRYLVAKFLNVLVQPITGKSVPDIFKQDCITAFTFVRFDPINYKIFTDFLDKLLALNINGDTALDIMIDNVIREFPNEPDHLEIIELHDFLKYLIMYRVHPEITDFMYDFCGEMHAFTAVMDTMKNLSVEERSNLLGRAINASNLPDYGVDRAFAILDEFEANIEEKSNLEGTNEGYGKNTSMATKILDEYLGTETNSLNPEFVEWMTRILTRYLDKSEEIQPHEDDTQLVLDDFQEFVIAKSAQFHVYVKSENYTTDTDDWIDFFLAKVSKAFGIVRKQEIFDIMDILCQNPYDARALLAFMYENQLHNLEDFMQSRAKMEPISEFTYDWVANEVSSLVLANEWIPAYLLLEISEMSEEEFMERIDKTLKLHGYSVYKLNPRFKEILSEIFYRSNGESDEDIVEEDLTTLRIYLESGRNFVKTFVQDEDRFYQFVSDYGTFLINDVARTILEVVPLNEMVALVNIINQDESLARLVVEAEYQRNIDKLARFYEEYGENQKCSDIVTRLVEVFGTDDLLRKIEL